MQSIYSKDTRYKAVLLDGSPIMLEDYSGNCTTDKSPNYSGNFLDTTCGEIKIYINGAKAPNKMGRDVFQWRITRNMVYPVGTQNESSLVSNDCRPVTGFGGHGHGCAAKILIESAINY